MKIDPAVLATQDYRRFIEDRVTPARISEARHVNRDMILLYWDIGSGIDDRQHCLVGESPSLTGYRKICGQRSRLQLVFPN